MYWLFPELYTALEEYYETKKLGSGNSTRWLVGHERKGASSRAHAPERGLGAKVFSALPHESAKSSFFFKQQVGFECPHHL